MPRQCDNLSVGVIIERGEDIALLRRAKFPIAIAPPAGHIDEHGSPEQAAINEVEEELGLMIAHGGLIRTPIVSRRIHNRCRRPGGGYHDWTVFIAREFTGGLNPSSTETEGADWYSQKRLQWFADRTQAFEHGEVTARQWQQQPGMEPVWVSFFNELGYLHVPA